MLDDFTEPGCDARGRLLDAALRLFAMKGYERATTREIAEKAEVNISAIRYYFGDKAGLYRAAFSEPLGDLPCHAKTEHYADLPLSLALLRFFQDFLEPLKRGEKVQLAMKLRFREMVEPTGLWLQEIEAEIKPQHNALIAILRAYLEVSEVDEDIQRLAFALIGMAVHFYVGQEVVAVISPELLGSTRAIDVLAERLAGYALSIVEGEAHRLVSGGDDGTE